jgi:enoyl-CoA hydratase
MLQLQYLHGNAITVATIDAQARRNAVDLETMNKLCVALEDALMDQSSRVFVLRGAGGHFSAGADLSGVESSEFRSVLARAVLSLARVPILTLAQIDGSCLGAGLQLAAACDLRIASPEAIFGIPAAKLGVAVDEGTVDRLVELVGGSMARGILLGADVVGLPQALDRGLVNRVGNYDDAMAWALSLSLLAPLSQAAHKAAFANRSTVGSESSAVRVLIDRAWSSEDLNEGRAAFSEKRAPNFSGR